MKNEGGGEIFKIYDHYLKVNS